jgi:hypothetical protein
MLRILRILLLFRLCAILNEEKLSGNSEKETKMQLLEHDPLQGSDLPTMERIERLLANATSAELLIGLEKEAIELPKALFQVLRQIVPHMREERLLFLKNGTAEIDTEGAAEILDVDLSLLEEWLEEKKIPFIQYHDHRKVRSRDVYLLKLKIGKEKL